MAINKNHEFEELNGMKCAIVERNVFTERAEFLKKLLEYNRYTVIIIPSLPKTVATPVQKPAPATEIKTEEIAPDIYATSSDIGTASEPKKEETFTIGVTDTTFNVINAIFGRLLKTPDGHIVTQAYWLQKESISNDEVPYYEKKL